jgi:hypothetical protein
VQGAGAAGVVLVLVVPGYRSSMDGRRVPARDWIPRVGCQLGPERLQCLRCAKQQPRGLGNVMNARTRMA